MKRLCIILLLLFIPSAIAQSYVNEWDNTYDMPGLDAGEEGRSITFGEETAIVAILSFSLQNKYRAQCILTHYDANGTKELEKVIPLLFQNNDERNVAVSFFNESVLVAYTYRNIHIMAYTKNGKEIWEKQWGMEGAVNDIDVDEHGNIYVIGTIHKEKPELCILKYRKDGKLDWNVSIWGKGMGIDVAENYIFAVGYRENRTLLLKMDSSGNIIWERTYAIEKGCDVVNGKEIIVAGENNGSITIFRCDKNGNVLWMVEHEKGKAHSIDMDKKGNIFVAGSIYNESSRDYDFLILEYNKDGQLIRKIQYNGEGSQNDEAWDVSANGKIVATGFVTIKKVIYLPPPSAPSIAYDKDAYMVQYSLHNIPPIANFSWEPEEIFAGKELHFFDKSYDIDGSIMKWRWDFGDGKLSYKQNPTHTYSKGEYFVNLTVTDDDGGKHWIVKEIVVHGKSTPGFEVTILLFTFLIILLKKAL